MAQSDRRAPRVVAPDAGATGPEPPAAPEAEPAELAEPPDRGIGVVLPRMAWGAGVAGVGTPLLGEHAVAHSVVPGTLAALLVAAVTLRVAARASVTPWLVLSGAVLAVAADIVFAVAPRGPMVVGAAAVGGTGLGLLLPHAHRSRCPPPTEPICRAWTTVGAAAAVGSAATAFALSGRVAGLRVAGFVAIGVAVVSFVDARGHVAGGQPSQDVAATRSDRSAVALAAASCLIASGLLLWVAAHDPSNQWFGQVYAHGPRQTNQVALTFDDGPDPTWTPEVAAILDHHKVTATFFAVGGAIDGRPDVAAALVDQGHVLGNHSYHHDYWRWLDPSYPELDRTQEAFRRQLDICPALFRPPHGQRTPFMLAKVRSRGMHAVTWDVSASDWSETDGKRVARRILDRTEPGSIILLHDGLDGADDADRSVLSTALPLIIAGLRERGLDPVGLDELLGVPAYLDDC